MTDSLTKTAGELRTESIGDTIYRSPPLTLIKRYHQCGARQYSLEQRAAAARRQRRRRDRGWWGGGGETGGGARWSGKYVGINPRKIMGKLLSLAGPAGKPRANAPENRAGAGGRVIRARNFAQFNFVNKLLRRISVGNKISKMAPGSMPNLRASSPHPSPAYPLNEVINIIERRAPPPPPPPPRPLGYRNYNSG